MIQGKPGKTTKKTSTVERAKSRKKTDNKKRKLNGDWSKETLEKFKRKELGSGEEQVRMEILEAIWEALCDELIDQFGHYKTDELIVGSLPVMVIRAPKGGDGIGGGVEFKLP